MAMHSTCQSYEASWHSNHNGYQCSWWNQPILQGYKNNSVAHEEDYLFETENARIFIYLLFCVNYK